MVVVDPDIEQEKIVPPATSKPGIGRQWEMERVQKMDDDPLADLLAPSVAMTVKETVDLRSVHLLSKVPS